jgi:hypothetical protein
MNVPIIPMTNSAAGSRVRDTVPNLAVIVSMGLPGARAASQGRGPAGRRASVRVS